MLRLHSNGHICILDDLLDALSAEVYESAEKMTTLSARISTIMQESWSHYLDDVLSPTDDGLLILRPIPDRTSLDLIYTLNKLSWIELHTGYWMDVNPLFRIAYTQSCLLLNFHYLAQSTLLSLTSSPRPDITTAIHHAYHYIDMGLIMYCDKNSFITQTFYSSLRDVLQQFKKTFQGPKTPSLSISPSLFPSTFDSLGLSFCPSTIRQIATIERTDCFVASFLSASDRFSFPVLIKQGVEGWPAINKWNNLDFWSQEHGERLVSVEVGSSYTSSSFGQKLLTIKEYLKTFCLGFSELDETKYLAQYGTIFDQIPELEEDIDFSHILTDALLESLYTQKRMREENKEVSQDGGMVEVKEEGGKCVEKSFWMGGGRTVSNAHTDPKHNFFCQVAGGKYFRLFSPETNLFAFPTGYHKNTTTLPAGLFSPWFHHIENMSEQWEKKIEELKDLQEDISRPELESLFAQQSYECIVEAGDVLYIPKRWWHHVEGLSPAISVNFWF